MFFGEFAKFLIFAIFSPPWMNPFIPTISARAHNFLVIKHPFVLIHLIAKGELMLFSNNKKEDKFYND